MTKFGTVPPEVPAQRLLSVCAPKVQTAVIAVLADLKDGREFPFETLRTDARQIYLHGFGRQYDDGRGIVTQAATVDTTWHGYGLAVDLVEKDATPWDAPDEFWQKIGKAAVRHGLSWGGYWTHPDRPHVQWGACPKSPTEDDHKLLHTQGIEAVWKKYGAI